MRTARLAIGVIGLLASVNGACADDGSPVALERMQIDGEFVGKDGDPAIDISGMSCLPAEGARRTCLVVNDENSNAQLATIQNDRITVGLPIPLIGKEPDPATLGTPPETTCEETKKFKDLDGEGVAYAEPFFYVVGSHGCSRKDAEFRLSSFILARVRVDRQGRPVDSDGRPLAEARLADAVQTTYRVSDLLMRAKTVKKFFGEELETDNGLNIEGIAAQGDTIWFGLRGPVKHGSAFLVGGSASDLFRPGHAASVAAPIVVPLDLDGLGIRDLAALPDKRLLVLAGAVHKPEVTFRLFVVDPDSGAVSPVGPLPKVKQRIDGKVVIGKAEGVMLAEVTADRAQIVVLFDGLVNGAPHRGEITLPR